MTAVESARSGRVGLGIIGAGTISGQYLSNLTKFPDVDVRYVSDLDESRAKAQAKTFGIPGYGSTDELLMHPEIEIAVNLTAPQAHVEVGLQAIAAGKHVWSEKPIALDREGGRTLIEAACAAGSRYACAPDTFLGGGIQTTRRLLEQGEIGQPQTALTLMQRPGPEAWHPDPAFLYREGAGPLFDMGPYYVTALIQMFGPVKRVSAVTSTAKKARTVGSGPKAGEAFPVTVPTHVGATFEFSEGQVTQSVFSFDSKIKRTLFELTGVDGAIEVTNPNRFVGDVVVHAASGEKTVTIEGENKARGIGVVELARAIRSGVPERANGAQAFHVLDVMTSILEAGALGEWVDVGSTFTPTPPLPEQWDPAACTLG